MILYENKINTIGEKIQFREIMNEIERLFQFLT